MIMREKWWRVRMQFFTEVIKIIEAGVKLDVQRVADYAELLAAKLEKTGELRKAERIRKTLLERGLGGEEFKGAQVTGMNSTVAQLPFDQESRLELADLYTPNQISTKKLIMSRNNIAQLEDFIDAYKHRDELSAYGLDVPATLLLYGPPGCGKTETAMQLAKKLDLPILIARLDTMISSFLGSTAKNIRRLFDYAAKTPCVLFLDEFDAVAKVRDDPHEMGELKRVVNSLLQNLDSLDGRSVLVAATNHENLLDDAIWRRFSTRIHVPLPTPELISEAVQQALLEFDTALDARSFEFVVRLFSGQSIADIQQILRKSFRKAVLEGRKASAADFVRSYFEYTRNDFWVPNDDESARRAKIKYLRSIDPEISLRFLGEVLNCHHSTVKRDIEKLTEETGRVLTNE
jgi:SpoVK/Ycf46/Vps4 family AAA+-type ATPase